MIRLLATRRFAPLFATQALGAFNDNLFRSAMLFLLSFRLMAGRPEAAALAASVSGAVFILPYLLFSALAGQLADRIDKARVARGVKIAEIAIVALGAAALLWPSLPLLYGVLFALGIHSTVFGPVKYAMLPQHLRADELVAGTGLVEAATFLAILAGQIAGGLLPTGIAAGAMLAVAVAGLLASLAIPPAPPLGAAPRVDWNLARGTAAILRHAGSSRRLFHAILGISWFYALGAVLTQQFVPLVAALGARAEVAVLFLALFSLGVALGALGAVRLMRGRVTAWLAAPAAGAIALAVLLLAITVAAAPATLAGQGAWGFLGTAHGLLMAAVLVALAAAGGGYAVPLYATLQTAGEAAARARDVAANNVANALAMVLVTILCVVLLGAGFGPAGLFACLALVGVAAIPSARRLRAP